MGNVLVVHADENVRLELRRILESKGLQMSYARDGSAAKVSVAARPFDAVVVAAVLPDQNGLRLSAELSELAGWAPVVVLGEPTDAQLDHAIGLGAFAVLTTPLNDAEVIATMARAIAKRSPWGWERRVA